MPVINTKNIKITDEMMMQILAAPKPYPSMFDRINDLRDEREEMLLAVMAAGVPRDYIELTYQSPDKFCFNEIHYMSIGFRFTTSSVYT